MTFMLVCENGKQIDMSPYILKQMGGEMTRKEVEDKIKQYQELNKI